MDNNTSRCAAGQKSVDVLSKTIVIGGVEPVRPGAAAVLVPKKKK